MWTTPLCYWFNWNQTACLSKFWFISHKSKFIDKQLHIITGIATFMVWKWQLQPSISHCIPSTSMLIWHSVLWVLMLLLILIYNTSLHNKAPTCFDQSRLATLLVLYVSYLFWPVKTSYIVSTVCFIPVLTSQD
jgi:hypothetical protein